MRICSKQTTKIIVNVYLQTVDVINLRRQIDIFQKKLEEVIIRNQNSVAVYDEIPTASEKTGNIATNSNSDLQDQFLNDRQLYGENYEKEEASLLI